MRAREVIGKRKSLREEIRRMNPNFRKRI